MTELSVPKTTNDSNAVGGFDSTARRIALALAETLLPEGQRFPAADAQTVDRVEALLKSFDPSAPDGYAKLLKVLEHAPRLTHGGRRFSDLLSDEASRFLGRWSEAGAARRTLTRALTAPIKLVYFDDPDRYSDLGCTWRHEAEDAPARWGERIMTADAVAAGDEIECDVVVVGTGAGGAVVAKELAESGHAVLMLEEGAHFTRRDFTGSAVDALRRFYRSQGTLGAIGNTVIPTPAGRTVGGSTTINSGTCFRTPEWVLDRWAGEEGLAELAPGRLDPYFERVEAVLQVAEADPRHFGEVGRIIARGCDVLGYSHRPLRRNAPECDGAGRCEFGCPTGAKRSTDTSYVPLALDRGAMLYTGASAEQVCIENGHAVGVKARSLATGHAFSVRAQATVLACGALGTPVLLQRQGIGSHLPLLGRNLSIHPAAGVTARFAEEVCGYNAMPQGYLVDEFHRDGFLLMGATVPIDLVAAQFDFVGHQLMSFMESYDKIAAFGVMVIDRSGGRVRPGPNGRPLVTYRLRRRERELMQRGVAAVCRIFLAAGAEEVYPGARRHGVLRSAADLARLEEARIRAADWLITAYHPLGTARMAMSADRGVVSPDHEVFGLPGLFIVDGSVLPGSPNVNPQVSIMALATRAADLLAERLEGAPVAEKVLV